MIQSTPGIQKSIMMTRSFFVCILIALPFIPAAAEAPKRPNIILVLADDLGFSDLGCFGGEIETPVLDGLAANGLRMTQLYNTARCCSTRASLLTGLYPHQAGVGAMTADNGLPGYRGFLNDRCVTIAELLQSTGYHTYLAGKWHLRGKGNPDCLPTRRGFDEFYGHFRAYASFWRPDLYIRLPENRPRLPERDNFYATDAITDYAIHFIREARKTKDPYFLYLAYNAPHFPLHAPGELIDKYETIYQKGWDDLREKRFAKMEDIGIATEVFELSPRGPVTRVPERNRDSPYYGKEIPSWDSLSEDRRADLARRMAAYAAMVEIVDRNLGRVVTELRLHDELDETFLVFLSDNGACAEWDPFGFDNNPYPANRLYQGGDLRDMGQPGTFHSYGTGWANACSTPLRLYKHYTHEGGISSPCIIHWPAGMKREGEIDRQPAHLVDLSATVLDLGETGYPEQWKGKTIYPKEGISLKPALQGQRLPERPLYFEHEGNRAVRLGRWKTVWKSDVKKWELYDISVDRSELNNLADHLPDRVSEMAKLWDDWAARCFVEPGKVPQPSKGMPKIYYLPTDEQEAARQIRGLGGHAFLNVKTNRIGEINLNRNSMTNDATMALVATCSEITDLSLEQTAVGDFGIRKLENLQNLEWLNLYQTRVTDDTMKTISQLKNLQHLPVGETGVTSEGLVHLANLDGLRYLGLRGNAITDEGVKSLAVLKKLTGLHLGETRISDRSLPVLANFSKLEKLWLSETPVTGDAVKKLMHQLPLLKEIHLQRTHLKIEQVTALRSAFPGCEIHYESD